MLGLIKRNYVIFIWLVNSIKFSQMQDYYQLNINNLKTLISNYNQNKNSILIYMKTRNKNMNYVINTSLYNIKLANESQKHRLK